MNSLIFGSHHLGAECSNFVGDEFVEGNHENGDANASQRGNSKLLPKEANGDNQLKRQAPYSMQTWSKVDNTIRVSAHVVDDFTSIELIQLD